MSFRLVSINVRGLAARERSIELCYFLRQHRIDVAFVQETNALFLDIIQDLCLGYLAAVKPPTVIRGSGLACVFAPRVAVLWPGYISIVSLDVHGQEVSVINCHLSHIPRERHQQLQIIAAIAVQENSWVLGDLNINEESTNDTVSGSVEALSELLDQTALVDVATLFDTTYIPTRVASYGSRVDLSRLDRILLPLSFADRVPQYSTIHYRLSDHQAVLLQLGVPPSPRQPCVAAILRSEFVVEHMATIIERTSAAIADMTAICGAVGLQSRLSCWQRDRHRRLPLGRAPGWDDLPCEFYMTYEDFFVNALKRVYEASQLRGALPTSTRLSTICLVPKSHGGPGLCGYRPISLFTADYRILGNILLRRLRPHLPVLVPQCQTYAVPDHGFLVSLMVSLRLPQVYIGWFLLLYAGAGATVRAGGLHTKPFQLLNGVRQGCAISAAMFSLATSPLLRRLEQALGPGNVLAYAEDIVLFIRSEEQFGVVTSIFENFWPASGISLAACRCISLDPALPYYGQLLPNGSFDGILGLLERKRASGYKKFRAHPGPPYFVHLTAVGLGIQEAQSSSRRAKEDISHKQSLVDGKKSKKTYPTSRVSWTERHLGGSLKQPLEDGKRHLDNQRVATIGHRTRQAKPATVLPHQSQSYEEEFAKQLLETLIKDRERIEERERIEDRKRIEDRERIERKEQMVMEFELEKLRIQTTRGNNDTSRSTNNDAHYEIRKLMPKYESKDNDLSFT
ncbi:hypothetical protein LAZ67_8003199 [Cordylochernes scorpioides]|uniref:Reverse transcriptase domain-containing protein n=1 Tax=Cordylochernes scorpioides TaxID=51811 RepID=A0ABY6KS56_9ARAC|nr:hypothetical protein LAZ67_8003199 [Cordylochernes scorpioides]